MAASMTMSLLPGTALADATSGVLADGTYESTAHVTRTAEDDEDENAWDEYDVNVKITVADGKFSDIAVTYSAEGNADYHAEFIRMNATGCSYMLVNEREKTACRVDMNMTGLYNVQNSL